MTAAATTDRRPIHAVLFDLSGTTVDEGYIRVGLAASARQAERRWGIATDRFTAAFVTAMSPVSARFSQHPSI